MSNAIYMEAQYRNLARWIPACGGTETWTKAQDGNEYLYVWWCNAPDSVPACHRHGWLDRNDIIHHKCPWEAAR